MYFANIYKGEGGRGRGCLSTLTIKQGKGRKENEGTPKKKKKGVVRFCRGWRAITLRGKRKEKEEGLLGYTAPGQLGWRAEVLHQSLRERGGLLCNR